MKEILKQKIVFSFLFIITLVVVIPIGLLIFLIILRGAPAISKEFLLSMPRRGMRAGGIFPAIVGSIYLVLTTIIIALPIGILAAIYLNEYSKENLLTRIIRLSIINLSGVPSIVYGLFGLGLFVSFFKFGVSILSGALTLSIMILPVLITVTGEALKNVPQAFREASLSLGVSKWQTIRYIVLPNAISGILTGTILGISRAAGETAPILFTVAAFYLPLLPKSVFAPCMVLPYHLYVISTQIPGIETKYIYGTALCLLFLVLSLNLIAIVLRLYYRKEQ